MFLSILFILLVTLGIGLPLILLIVSKTNLFIKLGLSFPIGIGVFTLLMFGTNHLGLKFTLLNETLLLLVASIPLVLIELKNIKKLFREMGESIKNSKFDPAEKIMLGTVAFLVVISFISTFYWPVYMWDSVVLYDFRGHVFATTGFMKDAFVNAYYYGYPLLTSLAHTIVYLCGGVYPQFIYSIFYLSLGVSFYGLMKEFVSRKLSLFASTLLLIAGPIFYHSLFSYTNLTYTVYLGLGAILINFWDRKRKVGYLILSALLIGLSTHVRSTEPFWAVALLVVIILSVYRKKFISILIYPLILIPLRQVWISYQTFLSGSETAGFVTGTELNRFFLELTNLDRWAQVISYLYKYLVFPLCPLFMLFVFAAILLIYKRRKEYISIFVITFLFMGVLVAGTFMFSIYLDYWNRIGDAVERLSIFFYPLFVYCIVLGLGSISNNINNNSQ